MSHRLSIVSIKKESKMSQCPKCGGSEIWDDNLWWGCGTCDFMSDRPAAYYRGPRLTRAEREALEQRNAAKREREK